MDRGGRSGQLSRPLAAPMPPGVMPPIVPFMVKKRRGSAKGTIGRQRAELRRSAPGKQFIGEAAGESARARAAERARVAELQAEARAAQMREAEARAAERSKVVQMHAAVRAAASRARELEQLANRSRLRAAARLVVDTTRLARTVFGLPLRIASAAASIPVRFASAVLLRPREA